MSWKTDLQLADLDPGARIEITCKRCNLTRYEEQAQLIEQPGMQHAYLDEVEKALRCSDRFCRGSVRLALVHDDKTEGWTERLRRSGSEHRRTDRSRVSVRGLAWTCRLDRSNEGRPR